MSLASDARAIAAEAVAAVEPARAVPAHVAVRHGAVWIDGVRWKPGRPESVHLVALGKAAGPLVDAARSTLGPVAGRAVAAVGARYPRPTSPCQVVVGEHPVPGRGSLRAGRTLRDTVGRLPARDPVLFLVSGGGSAIAEIPADGISGPDLAVTTRLLLGSGAPIGALNVVRRHLSALKGGALARAAGARPFATLAISDVLHDPPWDIAGGPTVPDPTTYRDALAAVRRYRLGARLPPPVLRHLVEGARGRRPETWKLGSATDELPGFHLIGSNRIAQDVAARAAGALGYDVRRRTAPVVGEASVAGRHLAVELRAASRHLRRRTAWISGGETTVTLGPDAGRGGRNEEMALAAAPILDGAAGLGLLTVATDGVDGASRAAGAWVDGTTAALARRLGVDLRAALRRHNADPALARLDRRYLTGATGTNVADLQLRLAAPDTESTARPTAPDPRPRRRS